MSSCDNDDGTRVIDPPAPTTEEQIIADSYVVRDAMEAFAAENNGDYPNYLDDHTDAGDQFITFLPGGTRLTNRYTGLATEPQFDGATAPGEIGILSFAEVSGPASGYRIVGRGNDVELMRIENLSQISQSTLDAYDQVFVNLDLTVAAAEAFAQQAGYYPADCAGDQLPSGETMMDFLPNAELLLNPFSELRADPMDGNAIAVPGGIGYLGNDSNGDGIINGYVIDAYGADGSVIAVRTL